jgi:hypothetical protein
MPVNRICGFGGVRIGARWADAYFRYEYLTGGPDVEGARRTDESWVVRVHADDFDRLALRPGRRVELVLPDGQADEVCVDQCWDQAPFVWIEFDRDLSRCPEEAPSA